MLAILKKFDFFRSFFHFDDAAAKAKERLRIVLIQDQSNVSSELLETLRREMIGVVTRYLDIDLPHLEMGIHRKDGAIALAANIPIVRIRKEGRALIGASEPEKSAETANVERRHRRSRKQYR